MFTLPEDITIKSDAHPLPYPALQDRERMLETYRPFILKTASCVLHRYVTQSDDAWSVALIAFWEATDRYREEKGSFPAYARLVIQRRLIDYQRKEIRRAPEIAVAPIAFTGDVQDEFQPRMHLPVQQTVSQEERLREEILDVSERLGRYGFSFDDLPDVSPKSAKTRQACIEASAYMLQNNALIDQMRRLRRLPIKALAIGTGTSKKLIERHRKYIIAVVEILRGEYPELGAYLTLVKRQGRI